MWRKLAKCDALANLAAQSSQAKGLSLEECAVCRWSWRADDDENAREQIGHAGGGGDTAESRDEVAWAMILRRRSGQGRALDSCSNFG